MFDSNSYTYTDDNFGVKSGAGGSLTSRVSIEEFRPSSNIMGGEIYNFITVPQIMLIKVQYAEKHC